MELFGLVDLIILGWECQGFLVAGFGEGLSDTRSSLFMDMVQSPGLNPFLLCLVT